ncbi:unnamed protein product [Trichobilharzia regenti]|nr:unnamed protein product [Trichobilharzia regenti]
MISLFINRGIVTAVEDCTAGVLRVLSTKLELRLLSVGWASSEAVGGTSADIAMRRKYLESPFLCLCQGGKTVSSLLKSSGEVVKSNCIPSGSKTNNLTPDNELVDMSSLSTHIINPALRDLSAQQVGGNSVSNCSIPVNCPFKASNLNGGESVNAEKHDVGIESRSILAGITYRPSGPLRGRDYQFPTSVNPKSLWICAFCGEDNKYTELGCLYGPYWLTEADIKQLPSELTYSSTEEYKLTPDGETQSKTPTSPVSRRTKSIEKVIRSGVITSTTTRSAAAQGRTTVANTGVLRLVIKASGAQRLLKNPPNECKTSNESSTFLKPRVGSGGEVWFHFECVLWAPGTYMKGNGVIGGLGEALQLALNAVSLRVSLYFSCIPFYLSICFRHTTFYHCAAVQVATLPPCSTQSKRRK